MALAPADDDFGVPPPDEEILLPPPDEPWAPPPAEPVPTEPAPTGSAPTEPAPAPSPTPTFVPPPPGTDISIDRPVPNPFPAPEPLPPNPFPAPAPTELTSRLRDVYAQNQFGGEYSGGASKVANPLRESRVGRRLAGSRLGSALGNQNDPEGLLTPKSLKDLGGGNDYGESGTTGESLLYSLLRLLGESPEGA